MQSGHALDGPGLTWTPGRACGVMQTGEASGHRPPGHHAFAEAAGGFCDLNNSAIAAQRLAMAGRRVAGGGAGCGPAPWQRHPGGGYTRADVLTVSLHAHPERFYPFLRGYADERGAGVGEGANLNLPPERGSGDAGFLAALGRACAAIGRWGGAIHWRWRLASMLSWAIRLPG